MIRILSAETIRQALPMRDCIEGMKVAFAQLSTGQADLPLRTRLDTSAGTTLFMPAYMRGSDDLAVKIVSIFGGNVARGLPLIHATVLVLDPETGQTLALLDGGMLTAIRTGAGGGASADLLARPDSKIVAMLGSGVQARTGLEAVCTVRDIEEVRVFSPNRANAERFAAEMAGVGPIPNNIRVVANPAQAVRGADIVYTATTASEPTFSGADLQAGAHVIGVGSYMPAMQEVDVETVVKALVVVDSAESAWAEAGDLIIPLEVGLITCDHIHAELGEIVAGHKVGRTNDEQITFFKSVGVAAQDAVAASIALQNAQTQNLGQQIKF